MSESRTQLRDPAEPGESDSKFGERFSNSGAMQGMPGGSYVKQFAGGYEVGQSLKSGWEKRKLDKIKAGVTAAAHGGSKPKGGSFTKPTSATNASSGTSNSSGFWGRGAKPHPTMTVPGYADGGEVEGPGGPKDDAIPARLSDGEYIIPAEVVKRKGTEFFDRLVAKTLEEISSSGGEQPAQTSASAIPDAPSMMG